MGSAHPFARIIFGTPSLLEAWKKAFPDPVVSPAHHARFLTIECPGVVTVADAEAGGWIPTFSNVERLELCGSGLNLVPFHNFSPVLKSLRLILGFLPSLNIFNLICSLPLLEDLNLDIADVDCLIFRHSTSPPLTGTLTLNLYTGEGYLTHRLLDLPNGLHFRSLVCTLPPGDGLQRVTALVEGCADTLEHVYIDCSTSGELLPLDFCDGSGVPT